MTKQDKLYDELVDKILISTRIEDDRMWIGNQCSRIGFGESIYRSMDRMRYVIIKDIELYGLSVGEVTLITQKSYDMIHIKFNSWINL
jgi:hypothetical protein